MCGAKSEHLFAFLQFDFYLILLLKLQTQHIGYEKKGKKTIMQICILQLDSKEVVFFPIHHLLVLKWWIDKLFLVSNRAFSTLLSLFFLVSILFKKKINSQFCVDNYCIIQVKQTKIKFESIKFWLSIHQSVGEKKNILFLF